MKVFLCGLAGTIALAFLGSLLFRTLSGPEAETRSAKGPAEGSPLVALATDSPRPTSDAGFDQSAAPGTTAG